MVIKLLRKDWWKTHGLQTKSPIASQYETNQINRLKSLRNTCIRSGSFDRKVWLPIKCDYQIDRRMDRQIRNTKRYFKSLLNISPLLKLNQHVTHKKPNHCKCTCSITANIYTPSVFCYDKHKKNFDIQFSMKRHETV